MNFTNEKSKLIALNTTITDYSRVKTPGTAFFILINNLPIEDLDNLCLYIQKYFNELNPNEPLSLSDCYNITQNLNLNEEEKNTIYQLAKNCVNDGLYLGTKTINNNQINTSSWISHCINTANVCQTLATNLNLDDKCAETLGLLHDYGRKFNHSFNHTIIGFEELLNIDYYPEALSCLTHSFLNGGRCANNEPALDGFYVDENGNPKWKPNSKKDDLTIFLETYKFSPYDIILNIADLTASAKKILPPHERVADIASRRKIDPINRSYFLCELINVLINCLNKVNCNDKNYQYIKATPDKDIEDIETYFIEVSKSFYDTFLNKEIKNTHKNTLK